MAETFAQRLQRLRKAEGLSIIELATDVGVSEATIRQLEAGGVKSPSFTVGLRIAHRLGVDPYDLAFSETSPFGDRLMRIERRVSALEKEHVRGRA